MKKLLLSVMSAVLMLALAACGAKEEPKAAETAPAATSGADSGSAQQVKLVASNFKFDQAEYRVKQGQDVAFTFENKEGLHNVVVTGLNVKLDANAKTATVKAPKAGTYNIICNLPCGEGHINMKSKLIVE